MAVITLRGIDEFVVEVEINFARLAVDASDALLVPIDVLLVVSYWIISLSNLGGLHYLSVFLELNVRDNGLTPCKSHFSEVYVVGGAFNYQKEEVMFSGLLVLEEAMESVIAREFVGLELASLGYNFLDNSFLSVRSGFEVDDLDFGVIRKEQMVLA